MWRVVVAASLAAASLAAASPAASPNATRGERVALAALVVSGHKAADEGFVQQSACAALALFASARGAGGFGGDAVLLAGPLGAGAPHDPATWRSAPPGWRAAHGALVARLAALVGDARDRASVRDLVPWLLAGQDKRAKFPTSKARISAVFRSFRLIFGRAIISWNGLEAWMLFPEHARAEHSR